MSILFIYYVHLLIILSKYIMLHYVLLSAFNVLCLISTLILTFGITFYLILDVLLKLNIVTPFIKQSLKIIFSKAGLIALILSAITTTISYCLEPNNYISAIIQQISIGSEFIADLFVLVIFYVISGILSSLNKTQPWKSGLKFLLCVAFSIFLLSTSIPLLNGTGTSLKLNDYLFMTALLFIVFILVFGNAIRTILTFK